ncbi:TlpA family protein disulfide reductase [Reichenbachiella agarivorans]|uniref:TlpA family protein disulfide reductase n=1 Tax=Reichenbachiella agarivorans TaxID=2979464 RepID=A0ABY6CNX9_9BACT|nr:TlpA disulfide reductase family protein [Reichenbachiella agarivorans]UXP32221.1 TlpA family protein disulfide reductase [Reichenbachiella agarivorans]
MKIKKEIREWGIMITLFGALYFTGYYKDVAGFLQRMILETRLLQPNIIDDENKVADYQFTLMDESGQQVDFSSFRGKTVFLNFWATWCPPCIAEMPDINALHDEVKGKNIDFVMISLDDDFNTAKAFKTKKNYTFPVYTLVSKRPDVFANQSIPTTFVIAPDGKIIAEKSGMAKYNTEDFRNFLITTSKNETLVY